MAVARLAILALLLASLLFAGCFEWGGIGIKRNEPEPDPTTTSDGPTTPVTTSCPTPALKQAAGAGLQAFISNLAGKTVTMRIRGTSAGTSLDIFVSLDPENDALLMRADGQTVIAVGPEFSISGPSLNGYGRDYGDEAGFAGFYDDFLGGVASGAGSGATAGVTFLGDLGDMAGVAATCATIGAQEIIRFTSGGTTILAERAAPYRPLQITVREGGEDVVTDLSYERPTIDVDRTLPRMPANLEFANDLAETNARGGVHARGTLGGATNEVPVNELLVVVTDAQGFIVYQGPLAYGVVDMGGGDAYAYSDWDADATLSKGDSFEYDLAPGLTLAFHDTWAGLPATQWGI